MTSSRHIDGAVKNAEIFLWNALLDFVSSLRNSIKNSEIFHQSQINFHTKFIDIISIDFIQICNVYSSHTNYLTETSTSDEKEITMRK